MAYNDDEIKRYVEYLQGIANRPLYQPNPNAAKDYLAQQKKTATTTKKPSTTVKKDTSKRRGLLDSLMEYGIKEPFRQQNEFRKRTIDRFSDGFEWSDISNTIKDEIQTLPKMVRTPGSDWVDGIMNGTDSETTKQTFDDGFFQGLQGLRAREGSNFTAGTGDLVKGTGDTARWLGAKTGNETLSRAGEAMSEFGQKHLIDGYEKPYEKEFTWSSLMDPEFYASSVSRTMPFMLSMIMPSVAGASIGAKLGGAVANVSKLGKWGQTIARVAGAGIGGSAVNVPFEAAFEAAGVFDEAVKRGVSPEEADRMAQENFNKNALLLAGTQAPEMALTFAHLGGFKPSKLMRAGMIAGSAGLEGGQEAGQEYFKAQALGDKVDPTALKESFAIGALMGGGMGVMGAMTDGDSHAPNQEDNEILMNRARQILGNGEPNEIIRNNVRQQLPDHLQEEMNFVRDNLEQSGMDPDAVESAIDEWVAEQPEAEQIIRDEVLKLIDRLNQPEAPTSPTQAEEVVQTEQEARANQNQPQGDLRTDLANAMENVIMTTAQQQVQEQNAQPQTHPLVNQYNAARQRYDQLAQEHDDLLASGENENKRKALEKQLKPLDKQISKLEKQMKKAGVSVPTTPQELAQEVQARNEQVNQVAGQADQLQQQVMGPENLSPELQGKLTQEEINYLFNNQGQPKPESKSDQLLTPDEMNALFEPLKTPQESGFSQEEVDQLANDEKALDETVSDREGEQAGDFTKGDTVRHSSTGQVGTYDGEVHQKNDKLFKVVTSDGKVQYWSKAKMKKTESSQPQEKPSEEPKTKGHVYDELKNLALPKKLAEFTNKELKALYDRLTIKENEVRNRIGEVAEPQRKMALDTILADKEKVKAAMKEQKKDEPAEQPKQEEPKQDENRHVEEELDENDEDVNGPVGEKPSKKSDEYQDFHNGDYIQWTDRESGEVRTGYVSGHSWNSETPGTLRPADRLLVNYGAYKKVKGNFTTADRAMVYPATDNVELLKKKPERFTEEEFVKDIYLGRLDVDPNAIKQLLEENGYGDVPLGKILMWKSELTTQAKAFDAANEKKAKEKKEAKKKPKEEAQLPAEREKTDVAPPPSAAEIEFYSEMARKSYHAKTEGALVYALNVIQEGTTAEHFSRAMKVASDTFGAASDYRNIFVEMFKVAQQIADAKFKIGDWVTYKAKNGRKIKAQVTALDTVKKAYTLKPHDSVHKETVTLPESLLTRSDAKASLSIAYENEEAEDIEFEEVEDLTEADFQDEPTSEQPQPKKEQTKPAEVKKQAKPLGVIDETTPMPKVEYKATKTRITANFQAIDRLNNTPLKMFNPREGTVTEWVFPITKDGIVRRPGGVSISDINDKMNIEFYDETVTPEVLIATFEMMNGNVQEAPKEKQEEKAPAANKDNNNTLDGYQNGFTGKDFKKGDTVYILRNDQLVEGTVTSKNSDKNYVELGVTPKGKKGESYFHENQRNNTISTLLYKKSTNDVDTIRQIMKNEISDEMRMRIDDSGKQAEDYQNLEDFLSDIQYYLDVLQDGDTYPVDNDPEYGYTQKWINKEVKQHKKILEKYWKGNKPPIAQDKPTIQEIADQSPNVEIIHVGDAPKKFKVGDKVQISNGKINATILRFHEQNGKSMAEVKLENGDQWNVNVNELLPAEEKSAEPPKNVQPNKQDQITQKYDAKRDARQNSRSKRMAAKARQRLDEKYNKGDITLNALPFDDIFNYAIIGYDWLADKYLDKAEFTEKLVSEYGERIRKWASAIYGTASDMLENEDNRQYWEEMLADAYPDGSVTVADLGFDEEVEEETQEEDVPTPKQEEKTEWKVGDVGYFGNTVPRKVTVIAFIGKRLRVQDEHGQTNIIPPDALTKEPNVVDYKPPTANEQKAAIKEKVQKLPDNIKENPLVKDVVDIIDGSNNLTQIKAWNYVLGRILGYNGKDYVQPGQTYVFAVGEKQSNSKSVTNKSVTAADLFYVKEVKGVNEIVVVDRNGETSTINRVREDVTVKKDTKTKSYVLLFGSNIFSQEQVISKPYPNVTLDKTKAGIRNIYEVKGAGKTLSLSTEQTPDAKDFATQAQIMLKHVDRYFTAAYKIKDGELTHGDVNEFHIVDVKFDEMDGFKPKYIIEQVGKEGEGTSTFSMNLKDESVYDIPGKKNFVSTHYGVEAVIPESMEGKTNVEEGEENADEIRNNSDQSLEGESSGEVQSTEESGDAGTGSGQGTGTSESSGDDTVSPGSNDSRSGGNGAEGTDSTTGGINNYRITENDVIGIKNKKSAVAANMEAIRLAKQIISEERLATEEEKKTLVQFIGWGGLKDALDTDWMLKDEWRELNQELKNLLTKEEFSSAQGSRLNAHYTSPEVIQAMYEGLKHFGFEGGRILEPSVGIGHFIGLIPEDLVNKSKFVATELEPMTGVMAQLLYPKSDIRVTGFEDAKLADGFFDMAIGNVPFGNYRVTPKTPTAADKEFEKLGITSSIHNYFFAKSLEKVREGGLLMFLTSRYTMDTKKTAIRQYLSSKAEFVGAVRLPNNAFKGSADTSVVTDLIILKKLPEGQVAENTEQWLETEYFETDNGSVPISKYFLEHPEMVLGNPIITKTGQYGDGEYTVVGKGNNLKEQLTKALQSLPGGVYEKKTRKTLSPDEINQIVIPAPGDVKEGAYHVQDGKIYVKQDGNLVPYKGKNGKRIEAFTKVRSIYRKLLRAQLEKEKDSVLAGYRKELNTVYDLFVKNYGFINHPTNMKALADDPDFYLISGLERYNKDTKIATKADVFTQNTSSRYEPPTSAGTPSEALYISLNEYGSVDMKRIAGLLNVSEDEAFEQLGDLVYKNPVGFVETVDEYLSGNIRVKLEQAKAAAESEPEYQRNVDMLEKIMPKTLESDSIEINAGAGWIGEQYTKEFVAHLLQWQGWRADDLRVKYSSVNAEWTIEAEGKITSINKSNAFALRWGSPYKNNGDMIEAALNNKTLKVYRTVTDEFGAEKKVMDKKATFEVRAKIKAIRDEFKRWLWEDETRTADLVEKYNNLFNNLVLRKYDGSHLPDTLPNMNPNIKLRIHQKNAIFRMLQSGKILLAHAVGAGKTFEMIAGMMEMKRVGQIQKPLWIVPNNLVGQMAADFMKLYPGANIYVPTVKDFEKKNRKKMFAKIASNSFDAVIIGHSSFGMLSMNSENVERFFRLQLEQLELAIQQEAEAGKRNKGRVRNSLEKQKKSLQAKMQKMLQALGQDKDTATFEEIGIDAIVVDESHEFKNLMYGTKMDNVGGLGDPEGSNMAFDMFMKVRYLQQNGGKVVFATGTPISNSLAEMYHLMRYMSFEELERMGLNNFDAWANVFAEVASVVELNLTGTGFRMKERVKDITNAAEVLTMFRNFADVQNTKELLERGLITHPKNETKLVLIKPTDELKEYVRLLDEKNETKEWIPLQITTYGRWAALDMRLIDPTIRDNPNFKVNHVKDNVVDVYRKTMKQKGTQIVFMDSMKTSFSGDFNVYNELKNKLVREGIPEKEIAFIQDVKREDREVLISKVNSGEIRVLIGSRPIMGAGMNAQVRLKAIHQVDVPWRPSDVEQSDGRILRQGNEFFHEEGVEIYRYVAEGSFDAYIWQLIESKAKVISSAMSGNLTLRRIEDNSDFSLSASEIKALATGDPRIIEHQNLQMKVDDLESAKDAHNRNVRYAQRDVAMLPGTIKTLRSDIVKFKEAAANVKSTKGNDFKITLGGMEFTKRADAGKKLFAEMDKNKNGKELKKVVLGKLLDFDIVYTVEPKTTYGKDGVREIVEGKYFEGLELRAKNGLTQYVSIGTESGTIQSMEYALQRYESDVTDAEEKLENLVDELKKLEKLITEPFAHQEQLDKARQKLDELSIELNIERNVQEEVIEDEEGEIAEDRQTSATEQSTQPSRTNRTQAAENQQARKFAVGDTIKADTVPGEFKIIGIESDHYQVEKIDGDGRTIKLFFKDEHRTEKVTPPSEPAAPNNPEPPAGRTVKGYRTEEKTDKHTKTGEKIWLVKILDTVENYSEFRGFMHKHGGKYYNKNSPYPQFREYFVFQKDPEPIFDKPTPPNNDDDLADRINRDIPTSDQMGIVPSLFRGRNNPHTRKYAFEDPVIRERTDAAMTVPQESFLSKAKEMLDREVRRIQREFEHLPNNGFYSPIRHELLRLEKQRGVALEQTVQNLRGILKGLSKDQYELFRNTVLMADLIEEEKLGHDLPFDFNATNLKHEYSRAQGFLTGEPQVQEALKLRKKLWDQIKKDYIKAFDKIGMDVSQKFTRENYFRHKIIEFAQIDRSDRVNGQNRLKTPKNKGYMKKREGSKKDFVTDYLFAESEVMANMLFDMEVAGTIKMVDQQYNMESTIKKSVEEMNDRAFKALVAKEKKENERRAELDGHTDDEIQAILEREENLLPERVRNVIKKFVTEYRLRLGKNHETSIEAVLAAMKGKVGYAYSQLVEKAEDGTLWTGKSGEYADLVDDLAQGKTDREKDRWFDYLSDLYSSGEDGAEQAGRYLKYTRLRPIFKKEVIGEDQFQTVLGNIPEGYAVWRPDDSNVFYMANTLPDHIAQRLFNGTMDTLTEGDFTKVMAFAGKRKGFIIPENLKLTLEKMMPESEFSKWRAVTRKIKSVLLVGPFNLIKYNARNITGDLDKVFSGNPDSLRPKYLLRATNELARVFFKHAVPTGEMKQWLRHGGTQTLLQSQEFGDIKELSMFRNKVMEQEMSKLAKTLKIPVKVWRGYWNIARKLTDYREAILRYATFLSYLDQIETNNGKPKNYGASIREEMDALGDKYTKAFNLSNDLLIPYDKTSVTGKKARDTIIPFASFVEGNIRSYIRLFRNAYHDEELASAVGRKLVSTALVKSPMMVLKTGKMAMKVAFLTVLTALYNQLFWPDEEEELPEDVKRSVHIVIGRNDDGDVVYFNRLGTLQDFLGWFGLDDVQYDVAEVLNGEKTFLEALGMNAIAGVNKGVQSIHPLAKQAAEQATGLKLFPDFRNPQRISDWKEHLMSLVSAQKEYAALRDKLIGRPHKPYDRTSLVAYAAEPEQTNYYNVKDMAQKAAEEYLGKERTISLGERSEKSEYLYEIKLGLRYNDMDYAQEYLDKYWAAGGTEQGLKASLKALDPLYIISQEYRQEYYDSLNEKDQAKVKRAYEYYQNVLLNGIELE